MSRFSYKPKNGDHNDTPSLRFSFRKDVVINEDINVDIDKDVDVDVDIHGNLAQAEALLENVDAGAVLTTTATDDDYSDAFSYSGTYDADAQASATAYGDDTLAETLTFISLGDHGYTFSSSSVAATA